MKKDRFFTFQGDDDVWVFINSQLALDLGGPHPPVAGEINLDTLGLTVGNVYRFDFFFCERHTFGSTLQFTTGIELNPCGTQDTDGDGVPDLCDYCPFGDPKLGLSASGTGLTQTFTIDIGKDVSVRDGLDLVMDFGDGQTTPIYTAIDTTIVHTYDKPGTYSATISSSALDGCAVSSDSVEVTLTTEGTRIAPKCSSIPVIPGAALSRRK